MMVVTSNNYNYLDDYIDYKKRMIGLIEGCYDEDKDIVLENMIRNNIKYDPKSIISFLFEYPWLNLFVEFSSEYKGHYKKLYKKNRKRIDRTIINSIVQWMIYTDRTLPKMYLENMKYEYINIGNSLKPTPMLIGKNYLKAFSNANVLNVDNVFKIAIKDYRFYSILPVNSVDDYIYIYKHSYSDILKKHISDGFYSLFLDDDFKLNCDLVLVNKKAIVDFFQIAYEREDEETCQEIFLLFIGLYLYTGDETVLELYDAMDSWL